MVLNVPNLQSLGSGLPALVGAVLRAQDKLNADLNQYLTSLFDIEWQYPQLLNAWVDFNAGAIRVRYALIANRFVVLSGACVNGSIGNTIFTLPQGCRPTQDVNCAVSSNGAFGSLLVQPTGNVVASIGSNTFFALDGCTFLAEQ